MGLQRGVADFAPTSETRGGQVGIGEIKQRSIKHHVTCGGWGSIDTRRGVGPGQGGGVLRGGQAGGSKAGGASGDRKRMGRHRGGRREMPKKINHGISKKILLSIRRYY